MAHPDQSWEAILRARESAWPGHHPHEGQTQQADSTPPSLTKEQAFEALKLHGYDIDSLGRAVISMQTELEALKSTNFDLHGRCRIAEEAAANAIRELKAYNNKEVNNDSPETARQEAAPVQDVEDEPKGDN